MLNYNGGFMNSGRIPRDRNRFLANIKQLADIFTIDVAAYAVMSNHYHIVVRVDNERKSSSQLTPAISKAPMVNNNHCQRDID